MPTPGESGITRPGKRKSCLENQGPPPRSTQAWPFPLPWADGALHPRARPPSPEANQRSRPGIVGFMNGPRAHPPAA